MYIKHALLGYLKRFRTIGKMGRYENKDAYARNMTRLYTIFWREDNDKCIISSCFAHAQGIGWTLILMRNKSSTCALS